MGSSLHLLGLHLRPWFCSSQVVVPVELPLPLKGLVHLAAAVQHWVCVLCVVSVFPAVKRAAYSCCAGLHGARRLVPSLLGVSALPGHGQEHDCVRAMLLSLHIASRLMAFIVSLR